MGSNIFTQKNGSQIWDVTIVGIAYPRNPRVDTNLLMFQYAYFNETRSFDKDTLGWMLLTTDSPAINDRVINAIDTMFANSRRRRRPTPRRPSTRRSSPSSATSR